MPRSCADRGGQGMRQGPGRMSYGGKEPRPLATSGTDPGIVGHDGPAHRWCARAHTHTHTHTDTHAHRRTQAEGRGPWSHSHVSPSRPSPLSPALRLPFCKMRSMCCDVCNLSQAISPAGTHTHTHYCRPGSHPHHTHITPTHITHTYPHHTHTHTHTHTHCRRSGSHPHPRGARLPPRSPGG